MAVPGNGLRPHETGALPSFLCDSAQLDVHDGFFWGDRRLDSGWVMVDDANPDSELGNQLTRTFYEIFSTP